MRDRVGSTVFKIKTGKGRTPEIFMVIVFYQNYLAGVIINFTSLP